MNRPRVRRELAKKLPALLAVSAALLPAAPALAAGSSEDRAVVAIETVTPAVSGPNDTVKVTGTVTNSGGSTLKGAHLGVRTPVGERPLRLRNDVALVAGRTAPSSQDGTSLANPQVALGDLRGGQKVPFTLQVTPADLKLSRDGVYELAVDVWDADDSRALGIGRTFLPFNTDPTPKATQVAAVWPLTHAPELVAQTLSDNEQTPVLRDDSLATELAPGGRLDKLVTTGSGLPGVTWAIDPDLLDTVLAMTKPYRVQKPHTAGQPAREDNTVPGAGKDAATAWLTKLRQAVATPADQVVALPYADPDLASIAHNGADLPGIADALRKAGTAGQVTAEGRLSVDVKGGVAWPYQGYLDQQTAALARTAGDSLLLVDGASMPEAGSLPHTPNAARPIGNGQTAVVSDHTVSQLFQGDLGTQQARTAAEQRFLAEMMTITREEPSSQRSLLVLPPRDLSPDAAQALRDALLAAQGGTLVNTVKLDLVATASPDPDANTSVPGDYPGELRGSELSGDTLGGVMDVQSRLDQLMRILTQPQRVRGPFSAAMVRSMSTEWRAGSNAGGDYRTGVQQYLDSLVAAVRLTEKSTVTLPGDNGTLLVSVTNDLNQAVGNLELRVTPGQPNRISVAQQPQGVVLDGTTTRTFRFPAKAKINGSVQMTAQLFTTGPDPHPYGDPVTFTVDVTSVASGVTYVILGGAVLIGLAGVRFYLQRKKRTATEPADGDDPREDSEAGAGQQTTSDEKVGP